MVDTTSFQRWSCGLVVVWGPVPPWMMRGPRFASSGAPRFSIPPRWPRLVVSGAAVPPWMMRGRRLVSVGSRWGRTSSTPRGFDRGFLPLRATHSALPRVWGSVSIELKKRVKLKTINTSVSKEKGGGFPSEFPEGQGGVAERGAREERVRTTPHFDTCKGSEEQERRRGEQACGASLPLGWQ